MVCPRGDGELVLVSEEKNHEIQSEIAFAYESALNAIDWKVVPLMVSK